MFLTTAFALGTILSAYGTYQQYQAANQAAEFQAGVSEQNARLAKKQEREIDRQSVATAKKLTLDTQEFIKQQLADYSASGVDTSSSTVQEVIRSTARTGSADIIDAMNNFSKEAWSKDFESRIETARATAERSKARRFKLLAPFAAAGDILAGTGRFIVE
jgi:YesN/AraC family two-component response regulator